MKPWTPFALVVPPKGGIGSGGRLDVVKHITHTASALRILEDGRVARGLIHDESSLNAYRTTVTWLSPNHWHWGSRYGNVEFSFDFEKLAAGRGIYWVESIAYKPAACRFLITDRDVSSLPVTAYDADNAKGPLRRIAGEWWWNSEITLEVMLDGDLDLADCSKLDFVKHHSDMCAIDLKSCPERGQSGDLAAARVVAGIFARSLTVVNHLLVHEKGNDVSWAADTGLCFIPITLGASDGKLCGPIKKKDSADVVLRAALMQLSVGDRDAARETAALLASDDIFFKSLARICQEHLGVKSKLLASMA